VASSKASGGKKAVSPKRGGVKSKVTKARVVGGVTVTYTKEEFADIAKRLPRGEWAHVRADVDEHFGNGV